MYLCQWHIDIPSGKQKEVVDLMKKWDEMMAAVPGLPKVINQRLMVGHIGVSPSHIINEYEVASLSDWEAFMKEVGTGRYHQYSEAIAKYIAPGSQHWVVYRLAQ